MVAAQYELATEVSPQVLEASGSAIDVAVAFHALRDGPFLKRIGRDSLMLELSPSERHRPRGGRRGTCRPGLYRERENCDWH